MVLLVTIIGPMPVIDVAYFPNRITHRTTPVVLKNESVTRQTSARGIERAGDEITRGKKI
jgi:hypothetical protein